MLLGGGQATFKSKWNSVKTKHTHNLKCCVLLGLNYENKQKKTNKQKKKVVHYCLILLFYGNSMTIQAGVA